MKSRDYRILISVLALVMVLGTAGWATAQQGNPPVKGSGTPNTIAVWTGSGTIGDSTVTQSGSNVSVGGGVSATSFTGDGSGLTNVNASKLGGFSPNAFAQVGNSNTFTGDQTINGSLSVTGSLALPKTTEPSTGVISFGGVPAVHTFSGIGNPNPPTNMFVGQNAGNFTMRGINNTATGEGSLFSDTEGTDNTAMGTHSLIANTIGNNNVAIGVIALRGNATGSSNTAIGTEALFVSTGNDNIAVGRQAGSYLTMGDNNIYLGGGVPGICPASSVESNTIRIGNCTHTRTFITGIYGVATGLPGTAVFVDANGQLGTIPSSRRLKDDIQDMGDASSDLMKLRPVTFRYKLAQEDGSHPLQYGLVAEEVAEVNPGLVQFDKDGQPQTVLYHVLPSLLLNEAQKQHQHMDVQEKVIQSQQEQIQSQQEHIQAQQEQLKAQEERLRKLEAILSSKTN
jgi:hypothetical protein